MKDIMKNAYKHLVALAVSAAALLTSVFSADAQNMTVPYKVENGIAYKKTVSQTPDENGNFNVSIETFVTGEVSQKQKPIPADIVLVLDVSGSMSYDYPGETGYIPVEQDWSYNSLSGNYYSTLERYYLYEGVYYLVQRNYYTTQEGRPQRTYYHCYLYFKDNNNQTHYLSGNNVTDQRPSTPSGRDWYDLVDETIFTGTLYRYGALQSRMDALQDAVKKFITVVQQKNSELKLKDGDIGNRIAIVKFASEDIDEDSIEEGNDYYDVEGSLTGIYNYTQVVKQFTPVSTGASDLAAAIDELVAGGATSVDYGLIKAQKLIQENALPITDENGESIRSRTVVVFTDGNPTHSSEFERNVAINAVNTAKQIKATTGEGACSAKIFSVGVFGDDKDDRTDAYMDHMSSNYPDATAAASGGWSSNITYTGNPLPLVDDRKFSIIVGNDKGLDEVFETIADISSGQNTAVGDDSVLTLDVVSSSFKLPDGVKLSDIHVYTAQCLGLAVKYDENGENPTPWLDEDGNQYLAFAEKVEAKNREAVNVLWVRRTVLDDDDNPVIEDGKIKYTWEKLENIDIDQNITPTFDNQSEENSVSVIGFNYSDYWCGLDEDHTDNTIQYDPEDYPDTYKPNYRGFKLILEFPIAVQEDAVGGPSVLTNGEGSGIYLTDENHNPIGEPLVLFNRPSVKLPVTIMIQKNGLEGDDSAVFTIYRYPFNENYPTFDPSKKDAVDPVTGKAVKWEHFTKIMITKDDKILIKSENGSSYIEVNGKKVAGLSPDYYYKLKEDAWAWTYQYQLNNELYTVGDNVPENPFVFENTPKDVKGAEAKVRNVFKEKKAGTGSGDDSGSGESK